GAAEEAIFPHPGRWHGECWPRPPMKKTMTVSIVGALALTACQSSVRMVADWTEPGCGSPDSPGPWARRFGAPGSDEATNRGALSVASDGSTVVYLAGSASAPVVKLGSAGQTVWGQSWPPSVPLPLPAPVTDPRECSTLVTSMLPGGSTQV